MTIVARVARVSAACALFFGFLETDMAARTVLFPVRDSTLIESPTGALSDGAAQHIRAGRTAQPSGSVRRGLVAFGVFAAIPQGSTVTGATLILEMSATSAGSATVSLHRVLAAWGEGTSASPGGQGAPATQGSATWLHRLYDRVLWIAPGGDFAPAESASATVGGVGLYSWQGPGMVADVQLWLDRPSAGQGWVLIGNEAAPQTVKRFGAREVQPPGLPPLLVIDYIPPVHDDDESSGDHESGDEESD